MDPKLPPSLSSLRCSGRWVSVFFFVLMGQGNTAAWLSKAFGLKRALCSSQTKGPSQARCSWRRRSDDWQTVQCGSAGTYSGPGHRCGPEGRALASPRACIPSPNPFLRGFLASGWNCLGPGSPESEAWGLGGPVIANPPLNVFMPPGAAENSTVGLRKPASSSFSAFN